MKSDTLRKKCIGKNNIEHEVGRMDTRKAHALAVLGFVTLGACDAIGPGRGTTGEVIDYSNGDVGDGRAVATVDRTRPSPFFLVSDTVAAGEPFDVTIVTTTGGCDRSDHPEVVVAGNAATVTPYMLQDLEARNCFDDQRFGQQRAQVTFNQAGEGRVTLHARDMSGEFFEVTETVHVR